MHTDKIVLNVRQKFLLQDEYEIFYGERNIAKLYRDKNSEKWRLILEYKDRKYILQSFSTNSLTAFFGKSVSKLIDLENNKTLLSTKPYNITMAGKWKFTDFSGRVFDLLSAGNIFRVKHVLKYNDELICTYEPPRHYLVYSRDIITNLTIEPNYVEKWESDLYLPVLFGLFIHLLKLQEYIVGGFGG